MAERGAMGFADFDDDEDDRWLPRHFWRFASWGGAATLAVALALVALASEQGSQRLASAWRPSAEPANANEALLSARIVNAELEARRLNEVVRVVSVDRDRLLSRMASLERTLDEMSGTLTGSVGSIGPAGSGTTTGRGAFIPSPGSPATTPPLASAPRPSAGMPPPFIQAPQTVPAVTPAASAPGTATSGAIPGGRVADAHAAAVDSADPPVLKTDFGIDVGGDNTVEGLRKMWTMLRGNHSALLEGLRPLMTIREGAKSLELRLVLGPLASPAVAARYCTALSVSGVACQPAPYDGQKLAAR